MTVLTPYPVTTTANAQPLLSRLRLAVAGAALGVCHPLLHNKRSPIGVIQAGWGAMVNAQALTAVVHERGAGV